MERLGSFKVKLEMQEYASFTPLEAERLYIDNRGIKYDKMPPMRNRDEKRT